MSPRSTLDFGLAPDFGGRLKQARDRAGITQKQLAFPGCTTAYLSRLESNERQPSLQVLEELARRLHVSRAWLLTGRNGTELLQPYSHTGPGCVLCGFPLNERARHYAEGDFCEDAAGCRRRALARQRALEGTLAIFHAALTDLLPPALRTDDVAMATLFPPEVVDLLKSSTREGDERGSAI